MVGGSWERTAGHSFFQPARAAGFPAVAPLTLVAGGLAAHSLLMDSSADTGFLAQADACLSRLVRLLDGFDPDELEADLAGGVLRISFSDGRNCILNRQAAASQLWLAEGASAWHFALGADGEWRDTKGRGTLPAILSEVLSRRLGRPIRI